MPTWTIAKKDLWLLLRDRRALVILLATPFIFILILGLSLGSTTLSVPVLDLDQGDKPTKVRETVAWLSATPTPAPFSCPVHVFSAAGLARANESVRPPQERWADVVRRDLTETGEIKLDIIESEEKAKQLLDEGKLSAILVFGPHFSERVTVCSFLADGINPFFRDGVKLDEVNAAVRIDPTQRAGAAITQQVAQVSLLRVILPWMIGKAFDKLSDPSFIEVLGREVNLPNNLPFGPKKVPLSSFLVLPEHKQAVGTGVKQSLSKLFPKYELTGKTWAALTKSKVKDPSEKQRPADEGLGIINRGSVRYQTLVPSYTVMFAFFLVLTFGWMFVAERRQGTLKRLLAAPLSPTQIMVGKMMPCLLMSLVQGLFLLGAGWLVFGMSWGPQPLWLLPVVFCTSLAAVGMSLLVATLARSETQVAIFGSLLVLGLALVSGCVLPRALMPDTLKTVSRFTPHAWALDAYSQLLLSGTPNYQVVLTSCGVLTGFSLGFFGLAWLSFRRE